MRKMKQPIVLFGYFIVLVILFLSASFVGSISSAGPARAAAYSAAGQVNPFRGWSSLGRPLPYSLGLPARGVNLDERQELFAIGSNGQVWHAWEISPGKNWSGWANFVGGTAYCVAVGSNEDGRMELFTLQYDHAIWHT
jgi:hypothetical protein